MTTDTDRELLELAAKAAGLEYTTTEDHDRLMVRGADKLRRPWDPITDDGDALRLVVRLGIDVLFTAEDVEAVATQHAKAIDGEMLSPWACESWTLQKQDPYAATRRAIVRAAAEIGRGME